MSGGKPIRNPLPSRTQSGTQATVPRERCPESPRAQCIVVRRGVEW